MERSGGMVTGSHERNELVRVRHGSDSRVGVSGFVSTLFFFFLLHGTFDGDYVLCFLSFGSENFVLSLCVILLQSLSFYTCNGNGSCKFYSF